MAANLPQTPPRCRDGEFNKLPRPKCLGSPFRPILPIINSPPGHQPTADKMLQHVNIEFSKTLIRYSETLGRLADQQNMITLWKDKFESVLEDYKDLDKRYKDIMARNLMQSIEIARQNNIIEALERQVADLKKQIVS